MPLIVDTCNLYHCIKRKYGDKFRLDYNAYLKVVERLYGPQEIKVAYVSYPNETVDAFITSLSKLGFKVITKVPQKLEGAANNTDFKVTDLCVEITLKALQLVQADEPMILGSSDRRLEPLLNVLKRKAGAVGVIASGVPHSFAKYGSVLEIKTGDLNEIARNYVPNST